MKIRSYWIMGIICSMGLCVLINYMTTMDVLFGVDVTGLVVEQPDGNNTEYDLGRDSTTGAYLLFEKGAIEKEPDKYIRAGIIADTEIYGVIFQYRITRYHIPSIINPKGPNGTLVYGAGTIEQREFGNNKKIDSSIRIVIPKVATSYKVIPSLP